MQSIIFLLYQSLIDCDYFITWAFPLDEQSAWPHTSTAGEHT